MDATFDAGPVSDVSKALGDEVVRLRAKVRELEDLVSTISARNRNLHNHCENQRMRLRELEGATNHAGGLPEQAD